MVIGISCIQAQQLAFPSAEGYGRFAKGGRGGDVYHVTNLNNTGPGSLREGIIKANGPRTIVFEISGTIELKSDLVIDRPYLTIAGQTAPGEGITLKDRTFEIKDTHNIIVRYIRIRYGDQNKTYEDLNNPDAVRTQIVDNVILDHISVSWGIDAAHDFAGGKFTLQWSMYGESLNRSLHHDDHPHAMLASFRHLTDNISLHHNLFFSSRDRHPTLGGGVRTKAACIVDFRNNVVFNRRGPTNFGNCRMNIINNYYRSGLSFTMEFEQPFQIKAEYGKNQARGFLEGNYIENNPKFSEDNFSAVNYYNPVSQYESITRQIFELPGELVTGADKPITQSAVQAYRIVLRYAGASKIRDAVDQRIIKGIKDRSNRLIDSQKEVGGWPILKNAPALLDRDRDGMPDAWETAKGLNPENPHDRNGDLDSDGYTNLEEYLNGIVALPEFVWEH
jgi:pectate lyase